MRYRVWPFVQQLLGKKFQGFDPVDFHPQVAKVPKKKKTFALPKLGWLGMLVGLVWLEVDLRIGGIYKYFFSHSIVWK